MVSGRYVMICLLLMGSSIPSGVIKRGVLEDLLDMEFHGVPIAIFDCRRVMTTIDMMLPYYGELS